MVISVPTCHPLLDPPEFFHTVVGRKFHLNASKSMQITTVNMNAHQQRRRLTEIWMTWRFKFRHCRRHGIFRHLLRFSLLVNRRECYQRTNCTLSLATIQPPLLLQGSVIRWIVFFSAFVVFFYGIFHPPKKNVTSSSSSSSFINCVCRFVVVALESCVECTVDIGASHEICYYIAII